MSRREEIENTLVFLAEEANAGRIEALFTVDVRRASSGEPSLTVHSLMDLATKEQFERATAHLNGIAEVLREVYADRPEVESR